MIPGARSRKRIAGAILCGGASSRMGAPKHTIVLGDGRMMIEHVFETISHVCDPVALLVSSNKPLEFPSRGALDAPIITDLRPAQGPLAGIESLLASGIGDAYIVCPCDVPQVTPAVFDALLEETDALSTVLRVAGHGSASPLPARFSASALPVVREMLDEGRRAVHHLHERVGASIIEVPQEWEALLKNVNTPDDLEELSTH